MQVNFDYKGTLFVDEDNSTSIQLYYLLTSIIIHVLSTIETITNGEKFNREVSINHAFEIRF